MKHRFSATYFVALGKAGIMSSRAESKLIDSSPPSTTARVSVVLRAPEDWEEWMLVVNTMARRGGVMDLVDVNAAELPEPTRPILPTYSAVKATAASMKDVDTNEQKDLTFLRENYREVLRECRGQD